MVFSSHVFLFYFLPLALALYYAMPRRGKHGMLTLLSYFFYGWANPLFVLIMLTSTAIDYACGLVIAERVGRRWPEPIATLPLHGPRTRAQRAALTVSICTNLGLLGFFKYFNFGVEAVNALLTFIGLRHGAIESVLQVTLPLGISFYTFQSMSYSIDVFRGHAKAIRNPVDFACYVAMFPQLVAGPIIRFQEVAHQLEARRHTLEKFSRGAAFFSLGMAKKILLANSCGKIADTVFDAGSAAWVDAWWGALAYSFQIYFDFSGYSDMAIGLGLMLGFVFPKNFDSPYHSRSITEFWRRWHISLSTWLRDYLYIPLGGNRRGERRTYVNLALVMLLGGLWHGAAWTFIIWGALHGAMLAFERTQGKESLYRTLPGPVRVALTYLIVVVAWVFFRSDSLGDAVRFCGQMIGWVPAQQGAGLLGGIIYQPYYLLSMVAAAGVTWALPQTWDYTRHMTWLKTLVTLGLLALSIVMMTTQEFNPFIYFKF